MIHSGKHMEASHHFELFPLTICFHIGPAAGPSTPSTQTVDQLTDTHGGPVWLLQSRTTKTQAAARQAPLYWSWKHSIRHRGEQNKPISLFPMLYCPLENINVPLVCIEGNGEKRTKDRMAMMLWRLADIKLLVRTVRFTVSISTFFLCRSIGSFSTTSILWCSVQFAPLRMPFIVAAL